MENINVALRLRPLGTKEIQQNDQLIWTLPNYTSISLINQAQKILIESKRINAKTKISFSYDYCFSSNHDNVHVYDTIAQKIVMSSLNGLNGTLFVYGQTGAGKTYTMLGQNQGKPKNIAFNIRNNKGLLQMALYDLFKHIDNVKKH